MPKPPPVPVLGELEEQLMRVLWRLESGTVAQVRDALPPRYRGAYTTVQTVLNRLAERGLLQRQRHGNAIVYRPGISEAEYVVRTIEGMLAGASSAARQTVLAGLIARLEPDQGSVESSCEKPGL